MSERPQNNGQCPWCPLWLRAPVSKYISLLDEEHSMEQSRAEQSLSISILDSRENMKTNWMSGIMSPFRKDLPKYYWKTTEQSTIFLNGMKP